jgi:hypothetical protein
MAWFIMQKHKFADRRARPKERARVISPTGAPARKNHNARSSESPSSTSRIAFSESSRGDRLHRRPIDVFAHDLRYGVLTRFILFSLFSFSLEGALFDPCDELRRERWIK